MPQRPNILFILTDQQRRDTLAAYGNDWIEAPNINGLARRSTVFDNAYVTQPVCTPSRASIMTGMYPQSTGLIGNGIHLRDETQDNRRDDLGGLPLCTLREVAPRQ